MWLPDCPVCGKENSAYMSVGKDHNMSTCSTKCAKRYSLWLRQGKVTDRNPLELTDDDIVSVGLHVKDCWNNYPFEAAELRQSKIDLRTQIKLLKRRVGK